MKMSRRDFVLSAGAAGLLLPVSCASSRRPEPRLLASRARLPDPFIRHLAIPPVLEPTGQSAGSDIYEMALRQVEAEILPGLKTQLWAYHGIFPGPTIEARRDRTVRLRVRNELPAPIVTHLHGGHTSPENDGYPTDLVLPAIGPNISHMHDPRAQLARGCRDYVYTNQQQAAMLWYHDHRMDFTAPQVWRGLAGLYIIRDAIEAALPLPNRSKEVPLMICDRAFGEDGSLLYPALQTALIDSPGVEPSYMGGVLGDVILVNGVPWPELEVSNTRYRFRILNASNARRYKLALDPTSSNAPAFIQIGSDGGLLPAPLEHQTVQIAPAERFDVVVDFSHFPIGSRIVLRNLLGTGRTRDVMRFHVSRSEKDHSRIPPKLAEIEWLDPHRAAIVRSFDFRMGNAKGHHCWLINGKPFDPSFMNAHPKLGSTEIWRITTDMHHPVHLHLVHFQVLSHSGRPTVYDAGWKDTVDLGAGEVTNLILPFDSYRGRYVFHCHNLEHEDMAMMGNFEVL